MDIELRHGAEPVEGYTLIERLGRGGFGEVWKATGPGGFQVALKFVATDENVGAAELRALDVIKNIRHPHLLGTFGSWRVGDRLIIAMELADRTLLDRFREAVGQGFSGIPAPEIFEHFIDAAKALDFLNEPRHPSGGSGPQGIQHRDVKPQNLLLVGGSVKVADFGLARVLENSQTGHTGAMTPSYAPPEFFERVTSSQSDQYSLAITYCQLRGGRLPFEGHPAVVMSGHMTRPPDLSMIPEPEREAVARALAKSPRDRWPSCRAFVRAVMEAEHGQQHAPPTVAPDDSEWRRKTTVPDRPPTTSVDAPPIQQMIPTAPEARPTSWPAVAAAIAILLIVVPLVAWGLYHARSGKDLPRDVASRQSKGSGDGTEVGKVEVPTPPASRVLPSPSKDATAALSLVEKGFALLQKDDHPGAIAQFTEAIRLDPTPARSFAGRALARSLVARPRPNASAKKQGAQDDVETALRLDPDSALAHAARAATMLLSPSPDFAGALAECDQAASLDPKLAYVPLVRAHIAFRRANVEGQKADIGPALKSCSEAIRLDPKLLAVYSLRGNYYRTEEEYEKALADFDAMIQIDPEGPRGHLFKGMTLQAKGEPNRAIRCFSEAIRLAPDLSFAYGRRAEVYESLGDTTRAEADRSAAGRGGKRSGQND